jgi:hypothetical protein
MARVTATKKELWARMKERETSVPKIARAEGVTTQYVYMTIIGRRTAPGIRAAIARAVAWPVSRIWPDAGSAPRKQATA